MSTSDPGYTTPDISLLGDEHVRRYEETNGEVGHEWNGATCLVLTTTGRKTGLPRKFALIYAEDGDDYLVVASMGGAPRHPGWYLNLSANPDVTVQVLGDRFDAHADRDARRAPTAVGDREPGLAELRRLRDATTHAEIPVVVLERR